MQNIGITKTVDHLEHNKIRKETAANTNTKCIKPSTIIVGAGLAGLACAIKLTQAQHKVTILEATQHPGGRARTIKFFDYLVDNGQHLLIGAYQETLKLIKFLNLKQDSVLTTMPMRLLINQKLENIDLVFPRLPAPLHLLLGLTMAKGLTYQEKKQIAKLFYQLHGKNFVLQQDCSILTALQNFQQSEKLILKFWEPIALAVMSTPITIASAQVFFRVLKDTFTGRQHNSNWLFTCKDLSELLPIPALKYLTANNAEIYYQQIINNLVYADNRCMGVASNTSSWQADNIVLATPAWVTAKLLTTTHATSKLANDLAGLNYTMITTIYFLFAQPVLLPYPMLGLLEPPIQWIFSRKIAGQANILSAIITGNTHTQWSLAELREQAINQLEKYFPNLPKLLEVKIIREQKAAFTCTPEAQILRPSNTCHIKNLFLAGDYTQTYYPATIEGAIRSGIKCAEEILQH